jgi:hypothetical protein
LFICFDDVARGECSSLPLLDWQAYIGFRGSSEAGVVAFVEHSINHRCRDGESRTFRGADIRSDIRQHRQLVIEAISHTGSMQQESPIDAVAEDACGLRPSRCLLKSKVQDLPRGECDPRTSGVRTLAWTWLLNFVRVSGNFPRAVRI